MLGLASFTFGLLTAVAAKLPQLEPTAKQAQANTYVYASDNHSVLWSGPTRSGSRVQS